MQTHSSSETSNLNENLQDTDQSFTE